MRKRNQFIRKLGCVIVGGLLGINGLLMTPVITNASQKSTEISQYNMDDYRNIIYEMVEAQTNHEWGAMADLWCDDLKNVFNSIYTPDNEEETGMTGLTYGKVNKIIELDDEIMNEYNQTEFNETEFNNIKGFFVEIDYRTNSPDKYLYNGVNYRFTFIGEEKGRLVIIKNQEAALDYLEEKSQNDVSQNLRNEQISVYTDVTSMPTSNDYDTALKIREARIKGHIVDSDFKDVSTGETYISNDEIGIYEDNYVSTQSFRGNYNYQTSYTGFIPGTITVYMTQSLNYKRYLSSSTFPKIKVDFKDYVKNVVVSEYGPARVADHPEVPNRINALCTQIVICKQYALWYTVYQLEYNDLSFDVYDSSGRDQNYICSAYEDLLPKYKTVIDNNFSNYYYYHYIVGSKYGNLFCTRYKSTDQKANSQTYGNLSQARMEQLADNGRSVEYILKDAYANTNQEGIGNIGALIYH